MAIDAEYKITAISGKDGTNGQNGASLSVQYSVNGTSNWHDTFASGDFYMRQKLGNGSWSSAMKIVGEDGQDGEPAKFVEIEASSGLVFKNGTPSQLPLKCVATGFTSSSYKWYKDGTVISGATSQTYNATSAGVYKVVCGDYSDIATVIAVSDGQNGDDGRGISSTEIKYASSTSNTTAPSSGWQDTPPSVSAGSYLWTRTTIKYTSGSDSVSYSVAKQGNNGSNGTSVTITSKSIQYQASSSGTTTPTGTWSDTVPSVSTGQYLWTKTVVNYSDGNSTTSYSVGYKGTNGTNGTSPYSCSVSNENFTVATGTDLKPLSVTTYSVKFQAYKGSTQLSPIAPSATIASGKFKVSTPTASGFTVAQSTAGTLTFKTATGTAISENLTVSVTVTYDNGSTETKVITISASKTGAKGADASQIGENLLHDSKLFGSVYGSSYPYYKYIDNGAHTANAFNGFTQTYCNNSSGTSTKDFLAWKNIKGFTLGDKYTLSFWAKGSGKFYTYWYGDSGYVQTKRIASSDGQAAGSFGDGSTTFTLTSEWKQYWVTWQLNTTGNNTVSKMILFRAFAGAQVYIAGAKFEKGETATAWIPHIDEQNITVSSTAITYQQSSSGTAVPTGTWSTTPPTATAGYYTWTRTIVTYSNGNTSTSYAVSKNGTNGATGSRAIRYIGKSATKPDSSKHTSATPVSGVTPIVGDWYLCTTDGYVYYCTKLPTSSANYYTWEKIKTETDYRLLSCVDDLIVLHQTVTTNTVLNTAVDNYSTALATGTLLAQKIFTNSIKLQGDFKIYTDDNKLIANFENRGRVDLSRIYCDFLEASEYVSANVTFNSSYTERYNNHYEGGLVVGSTEEGETEKIRILHSFIQALIDGNPTSLQLSKIGGGVIIGDSLYNYDINDANELRVSSYLPFEFKGYGGNYPLESWCKVLGVYRSSLDLSSNKNKRGWSTGTAYKVGDIVLGTGANSVRTYWRCKTAHTSSSSIPLTNTSYWEDATQSGYIVFSNGLCIQWGKKQQSDSTEGMRQYFPIRFTVPPIVTANSNSQDSDFKGIQECTTTYFKCDTNSGYSNKKLVYWIAIGY